MARILAYWNFRGLAEPIRMLLHHSGVDFEDKRYTLGPPSNILDNEWSKVKYKLGLDFPNVPYYIDSNVKLSQSLTIMRYLAKKHGMYPTSESELLQAESLEQVSRDILQGIIFASMNTAPSDMDEIFKLRREEPLRQVARFLGDKKWLLGDKLCYADFLIYECISHYSYFDTKMLLRYPVFSQYLKRLEALPNIQQYMKGGSFKEWPLYGPIINWGSGGECPKREGI